MRNCLANHAETDLPEPGLMIGGIGGGVKEKEERGVPNWAYAQGLL